MIRGPLGKRDWIKNRFLKTKGNHEPDEDDDDDNDYDQSFEDKKKSADKLFRKNKLKQFFRKLMLFSHILEDIETKYGGGFLSLFELIRWLIFISFTVALLITVFIVLPHFIYDLDSQNELDNFDDISPELCTNQTFTMTTTPLPLSDSNFQDTILLTKCCSLKYNEYLNKKITNESTLDKFFDIIQGTGILEKSFVFYGNYSNKASVNVKERHSYYMGLSFVAITLFSLLISAICMLLRVGKGLEKSIINKLDSTNLSKYSNQVFSFWDYNLKEERLIKLAHTISFSFIKTELEFIKNTNLKKSLSKNEKLKLNLIRILFHLLTILLFCVGGYGFYVFNQFSFEARKSLKNQYLQSLLSYSPAIFIKIIYFIFPWIFKKLEKIENYDPSFKLTLFLLRTTAAKIGSLLFLIITIGLNIIKNPNPCASQNKNSLLTDLIGDFDFSLDRKNDLWCWETYVGQEFYKLVFIDFIIQIALLIYTFLRKSQFDLETNFLDLLNTQNYFWIGLYFSPFLGLIAPFYYTFKFYIKLLSLKLGEKTDQNEVNSKINSSFFMALFTNFMLILILYGFILTSLKPSRSCGPFRLQNAPNNDFTILYELNNQLNISLPNFFYKIVVLIFSSVFLTSIGIIMIGMILLVLGLTKSRKRIVEEMNNILNEEKSKNDLLAAEVRKLNNEYIERFERNF